MATILHVSDYASLGGAEVVFGTTVAASRELGHRSEVAVADPVRSPLSYVWSRRNLTKFAALLDEVGPDIVHLQNFYHLWSPSILGAISRYRRSGGRVKVVLTAHDFHLACPNSAMITYRHGRMQQAPTTSWQHLISRRYDRRSHLHSVLKKTQYAWAYMLHRYQHQIDLVLSPSQYLRGVLERSGITIPVELVRNPVDEPLGADCPTARRQGVVYFGRLTAEKGILDGARMLSAAGIGLDIYGDGEHREQLAELAQLDSAVRLHSALDHDRMMAELGRYSVMIMPSPAAENAPLSVVEAAMRGVKVVAVQGSGAAEMAGLTEVATVYDPQAPGEFVRAVRESLVNPATNRLIHPSEFTPSTYRAALAGVYARLSAELELGAWQRSLPGRTFAP